MGVEIKKIFCGGIDIFWKNTFSLFMVVFTEGESSLSVQLWTVNPAFLPLLYHPGGGERKDPGNEVAALCKQFSQSIKRVSRQPA